MNVYMFHAHVTEDDIEVTEKGMKAVTKRVDKMAGMMKVSPWRSSERTKVISAAL